MTSHVLTAVLTVAGQDSLFLCEVEKLRSRMLETLNTCRYVDSVTLVLTGVGAETGVYQATMMMIMIMIIIIIITR